MRKTRKTLKTLNDTKRQIKTCENLGIFHSLPPNFRSRDNCKTIFGVDTISNPSVKIETIDDKPNEFRNELFRQSSKCLFCNSDPDPILVLVGNDKAI